MPDTTLGFATHQSGLLVPAAQARQREVWTNADWKVIDRAMKLLSRHRIAVFFGCEEGQACRAERMSWLQNLDGSVTLRCAHKDRVIMRMPPR